MAHTNAKVPPGLRVTAEEHEWAVLLTPAAARACRGVAARVGYVACDRFDLLYAAQERLLGTQSPMHVDLKQLKHAGRYFMAKPRVALQHLDRVMNENGVAVAVAVLADTDCTRGPCAQAQHQ